ncbi:hypothetical protein SLA2020_309070 [Shorea laevis]
MENLTIPSSASRPLVIIPPKQESLSEFLEEPTKAALSDSKSPNPKTTDTHLVYLGRKGSLSECIRTLDAICKTGSKVNNFSLALITVLSTWVDSFIPELTWLRKKTHLLGLNLSACIQSVDPYVMPARFLIKCGREICTRGRRLLVPVREIRVGGKSWSFSFDDE